MPRPPVLLCLALLAVAVACGSSGSRSTKDGGPADGAKTADIGGSTDIGVKLDVSNGGNLDSSGQGADLATPDGGGVMDAAPSLETQKADAAPPADASPQQLACQSYCATIQKNCKMPGPYQYGTEPECNAACATLFKWELGSATTGNTLMCRAFHATEAGNGNLDTHCPAAGETGNNTCGTWCDNYCDVVMLNCTGDNKVHPDRDACKTACIAFPTNGPSGSISGYNVQCKINLAGIAGRGPGEAMSVCKGLKDNVICAGPAPKDAGAD